MNYNSQIQIGKWSFRFGIIFFLAFIFLGWSGLNYKSYQILGLFVGALIFLFISLHFDKESVDDRHKKNMEEWRKDKQAEPVEDLKKENIYCIC